MTAPVHPPATPIGERVVRTLVAIAVAAFVLTTVGHVVDLVLFDRVIRPLDVEDSRSIAAWASIGTFTLASAAAALLAIVRRPLDWSIALLAVALAVLSADDGGVFDQIIRRQGPPRGEPSIAVWVLGIGPLMLLSIALSVRLARRAPSGLARPMWFGFALLALALIGDVIVAVIDVGALEPGAPLYELEAMLEEGFELLGVGLLTASLFGILVDEVVRGPVDRP